MTRIIERICGTCRREGYTGKPVVAVNEKGQGLCEEHSQGIPGLRQVSPIIDLGRSRGRKTVMSEAEWRSTDDPNHVMVVESAKTFDK